MKDDLFKDATASTQALWAEAKKAAREKARKEFKEKLEKNNETHRS